MKLRLMIGILFLSFIFPQLTFFTNEEYDRYKYLSTKIEWLTPDYYLIVKNTTKKYDVEMDLALSLVEIESNGKNVVSRLNKNGTRDYGRFQVNSVHEKDNPKKLLNDGYNTNVAINYLSKCIDKASGNYFYAIRFYNAGLNCSKNVNNVEYIIKVLNFYYSL